MDARADADAYAFDLYFFSFLGRLPRFLFLFVKVLAAIHYFRDRRVGGGGYLYQIKPNLMCCFERFLQREQTKVCSIVPNDPKLC